MTLSIERLLTLAEFLDLPETKPATEFMNGELRQKPMPQGKHSVLQALLVAFINSFLLTKGLALALTELRCTFSDRSLVPDIAVFRMDRVPWDKNGEIANQFTVPPDWVIEILPPEQSETRIINKLLFFVNHGTHTAWLINPAEKMVLVIDQDQKIAVFSEPEQNLPIPGLGQSTPPQLTLGQLFQWLQPTQGK